MCKIKILLLILLLLSCFIAIFLTPVWGDEKYYHYPNAQDISLTKIIDAHSSYSSAYTPLPYILGNFILRINQSIYALRLLNYLIFMLFIYFIYKIGIAINFDPVLLVLLLISNPYLLRSSFVYYMSNYGLLFSTIGIYFYFFSKRKYKLILSHLFFGLAILCQQWMLIIVFSLFLNEILLTLDKKISNRHLLISFIYKMIFSFPAFLLFYFWGGLNHPNFQTHMLKPSFEHLFGVLANYGLIGIFIVIFYLKKLFE